MTPKTGAIRLATLRLFLPDGGCALSGLWSVRPAFNLFTMLTETAGVGGLKTPGGAWTAPQKLDTQLSKVQFYG
ncbi:hypothetical protein ACUZ90_25985 [Klebsiella pneumoniae]|uniref:hypothetical protein n=1 Tax=Klebsiella pneumoniae TaxID=573 RepID=UPI00190AD146|nr:hypothetical protein [Klebsiella pneumoniae]